MSRFASLRAFCAALVALVALSGCDAPQAGFYYVTDPPVTVNGAPHGIVVPYGGSVTVVPYESKSQIEGGPQSFAVEGATSEDPTIATTTPTAHEYRVLGESLFERGVVITGLRVGTTKLRLWGDDPEEGTLPITVILEDR